MWDVSLCILQFRLAKELKCDLLKDYYIEIGITVVYIGNVENSFHKVNVLLKLRWGNKKLKEILWFIWAYVCSKCGMTILRLKLIGKKDFHPASKCLKQGRYAINSIALQILLIAT